MTNFILKLGLSKPRAVAVEANSFNTDPIN